MNKPITKELVSDWKEANNKAGSLEEDITDRIDYVLRFMFKTFGGSIDTWYFDNAAEGEVGDLDTFMSDTVIYGFEFDGGKDTKEDMIIIDKNNKVWSFDGEIPTRWLFEESFEEELVNGKKSYQEKESARKLKQKEIAAAKKKEDTNIVNQLKTKLSKKELAALKRSL